jgi:hypothetical protein
MHQRIPLGVVLALVAACAEDNLTRHAPQLLISPYIDENTNYAQVLNTTPLTIDLGDVAVYSTRPARFWLDNPTNVAVLVQAATYTSDTVGADWLNPEWVKDKNDPNGKALPLSIPPFEKRILNIRFSPAEEGPAEAIVQIDSPEAKNATRQFVSVKANGVYQGAPDVEIEYNGIIGPRVQACSGGVCGDCVDIDTDDRVDGCAMTQALDFGGVGLGAQSSQRLFIRNAATCAPYPGAEACGTCVLSITGLRFKAGTNDAGLFSFQGSTATPFSLPQDESGCTQSNFVRPVLNFSAETEGMHSTVIIVESNDPDEPMIEIPVTAGAVNAPIAIAKFKAFDPSNPSAPWTDPDEIEPYERVYLDGLARGTTSTSHDPRDPSNPSLIWSYQWSIEGPSGVDPAQYDANPTGMRAGLVDFYVPLAGHYIARLTVTNDAGLNSLDTEISKVEFDAIPRDRMHIQLVWSDPSNDQDLHLTSVMNDDRVCNQPWDCHWLNRTPTWFAGASGTGPNPALDVDDVNGLGPENINIEDPNQGVYRIYVHYYGDHNFSGNTPTDCTVRVYLNGLQVGEYTRTLLVEKSVWAVADITWNADNTGVVTPYPSDSLGQVGSVQSMQDCTSPGWTFP